MHPHDKFALLLLSLLVLGVIGIAALCMAGHMFSERTKQSCIQAAPKDIHWKEAVKACQK